MLLLGLVLAFCTPSFAASKYFFEKKATSGAYLWSDDDSGGGASSNWSSTASPTYTATTKPANKDTVVITASTTCTYDEAMTGGSWADGVILTVNGTLQASTTTATCYLKSYAQNVTVASTGRIRAGTSTSVPYPSTSTFTIDFATAAKTISVASGGHLYLYCTQPTHPFIALTAQAIATATQVNVDANVVGETPWTIANAQVRIVDSLPLDCGINTISSLDTDHLHVSALSAQKEIGALAVVMTRNVRIINVGTTTACYAITYATGAGSGDYLGCEMNAVYRGVSGGDGYTWAGTCECLTSGPQALVNGKNLTISGWLTGTSSGSSYGTATCDTTTMTSGSLIAGCTYGMYRGMGMSISGRIFGCSQGTNNPSDVIYTSTAQVDHCTTGLMYNASAFIYCDVLTCTTGIQQSTGLTLANCTLNNTTDMSSCSGRAFNVQMLGGTEHTLYNASPYPTNGYFDSADHDGSAHALTAWSYGGVVTHQTSSPPSGYTIYYRHACASASYPCIRQYQSVVDAGQTIIVTGLMRIVDGNDLSADPPKVQIIDAFADPLVDGTQAALAYCNIPVSNGTSGAWQDVAVAWTNTASSSRIVYVRLYAKHATETVDECIYSPSTAAQVSAIYAKLPTKTYLAGTSNSSGAVEASAMTGNFAGSVNSVSTGVTLSDDAITSAKFDESSAYPLKSADTGSTAVARTGADSDTMKTLSDQMDGMATEVNEVNGKVDAAAAEISSVYSWWVLGGDLYDMLSTLYLNPSSRSLNVYDDTQK